MVTAHRAQQKQRQGQDDHAQGQFIGPTDWKVHLGTLTKGHWRFTAVVTDKSGRQGDLQRRH